MIRFYSLLLFFIQIIASSSSLITDYSLYLQKWKQIATSKNIVNVTHLANNQEVCNDGPCQLFYYLHENQQLSKDSSRNRTVLVVAGLQGNDYLAANTMLNIYGQIEAARVIYFAVANPSGFIKNTSKTFPNAIDIQSGFPNAKDSLQCYQSSALNILQNIYSTYQIDLTILIQEGKPSFGYSSSLNSGLNKSVPLQEQAIYRYVFNLINEKSNELSLQGPQSAQSFQIDEASSSFIDWAYAASRFPEIIKPSCNQKMPVKEYNKNMNGLAFALSIGVLKPEIQSEQSKMNLLISNIAKIIQYSALIVNPQMRITSLQSQAIQLQVQGCSIANLTQVVALHNGISDQLLRQSVVVDGTADNSQILKIDNSAKNQLLGAVILLKYTCDLKWQNLGTTFFAQLRQYTQQHQYQIQTKRWKKFYPKQDQLQQAAQSAGPRVGQQAEEIQKQFSTQPQKTGVVVVKNDETSLQKTKLASEEQSLPSDPLPLQLIKDLLKTVLVGGLVIVTACYLLNCCKVGLAVFSSRNHRYVQKFEQVQYVQNAENETSQERNQQNQQLVR